MKTDIVYTYGGKVYLNITNACPCKCRFCIRNNGDAVGEAKTLWFDNHMPSFEEVKQAVDDFDFSEYGKSIIICGYGEPTCSLEVLLNISSYIKEKGFSIRLNTNGLSDLINKKETAKDICSTIDEISISLNAPDAQKYVYITQPSFGEKSFEAMLDFAKKCKAYGSKVTFTVVDVIPKEDILLCQDIADKMGIPLRVREYSD
ncbi:MAG: TIGR04100 family radical SAM protein [Clostridiales bacterium]|nr:TIGR04100 family radical SAM protein [Clostridiales bacterium]